MPSTRRRLLTRAGQAITVGLAGCATRPPTEEPRESPQGSPTESPTSTASPTPTPTPTAKPHLANRTFESVETACGERVNEVQVKFEPTDSGGRVRLTGTITGPNTCQIAALKRATVDGRDFNVSVKTVNKYADDPNTTPVCGQCIVEVDYRGRFEFEGSVPDRVRVFHVGNYAPNDPVAVVERD